mmetsp:Transcript_11931/g.28087  ORF Transcript_11931/g.28087 Transcript_11931/m.28087 type:complete len:205 (+) Transcript_11931:792-1406(+)
MHACPHPRSQGRRHALGVRGAFTSLVGGTVDETKLLSTTLAHHVRPLHTPRHDLVARRALPVIWVGAKFLEPREASKCRRVCEFLHLEFGILVSTVSIKRTAGERRLRNPHRKVVGATITAHHVSFGTQLELMPVWPFKADATCLGGHAPSDSSVANRTGCFFYGICETPVRCGLSSQSMLLTLVFVHFFKRNLHTCSNQLIRQ